ncbi:MAG: hypothetical protein ACXWG8_10300 [Usitatibacter sp.]
MIGDAVIGGALGGGLRLLPELLAFIDRDRERQHEVKLQRVALGFERMRQESQRMEIATPEYHAAMTGSMTALADTIREQFKATKNEAMNAVSILVRPATTYALVLLYLTVKLTYLVLAAQTATTFSEAARLIYTAEDYTLLGGILAFWFADRALKK